MLFLHFSLVYLLLLPLLPFGLFCSINVRHFDLNSILVNVCGNDSEWLSAITTVGARSRFSAIATKNVSQRPESYHKTFHTGDLRFKREFWDCHWPVRVTNCSQPFRCLPLSQGSVNALRFLRGKWMKLANCLFGRTFKSSVFFFSKQRCVFFLCGVKSLGQRTEQHFETDGAAVCCTWIWNLFSAVGKQIFENCCSTNSLKWRTKVSLNVPS